MDVSLDYLVFGTLRAESLISLAWRRNRDSYATEVRSRALRPLVAMFRLLPESEREDIFDVVHLKYKRYLGKKAESIYWTYFDESADERSGPAEDREARGGTA